MSYRRNSEIIDWIADELSVFVDDRLVTVETHRIEPSALAGDTRFHYRFGVYSGGDSVDSVLPGMNRRGLRYGAGKATSTVQTYNVDISASIAQVQDSGKDVELALEDFAGAIEQWAESIAGQVHSKTDGRLNLLLYTGSGRPLRVGNYSTKTVTLSAERNILLLGSNG